MDKRNGPKPGQISLAGKGGHAKVPQTVQAQSTTRNSTPTVAKPSTELYTSGDVANWPKLRPSGSVGGQNRVALGQSELSKPVRAETKGASAALPKTNPSNTTSRLMSNDAIKTKELWKPGDSTTKGVIRVLGSGSYLSAAASTKSQHPFNSLPPEKGKATATNQPGATAAATAQAKKRKPTETLELDLLSLALKSRKAEEKRKQSAQQPRPTRPKPSSEQGKTKIGKVRGAGAIARRKNRLSSLKKRVLQDRKLMLWLLKPETRPFPLQTHPALIDHQCVWLPRGVFDKRKQAWENAPPTIEEDQSMSSKSNEEGDDASVGDDDVESGESEVNDDDESPTEDEKNSENEGEEASGDEASVALNAKVAALNALGVSIRSALPAAEDKQTTNDDDTGTVPFDASVASPVFFGCFYRRQVVSRELPTGDSNEEKKKKRTSLGALPLSRPIREYVDQALSTELDEICLEALHLLFKFQERARAEDPVNAKLRRRLVMGMHEVRRGVRSNRCIAVIVAPNLEDASGIDEKLEEILQLCREKPRNTSDGLWSPTPIIYASSRKQLGRTLGKRGLISCIGIYSADGAHEQMKRCLKLAEKLKDFFHSQVESERALARVGKRLFCDSCLVVPLDQGYVRRDCFVCKRSYCELCASKKLNPQNKDWCSSKTLDTTVLCNVVKLGRAPPKVAKKSLSVQAKEFVPPVSFSMPS